MSFLSTALTVGGSLAKAFGKGKEGQAGAAAGGFNSAVALQEAVQARKLGAYEATRVRREGRRAVGAIKAAAGATGVVSENLNTLIGDSVRNNEADALAVEYNAKSQEAAYKNEATLAKLGGKSAATAGRLGVIGQGFSTAATLLGR